LTVFGNLPGIVAPNYRRFWKGVSLNRCCVLHTVHVSNWNRLQYSAASHHLLLTEKIMAKVNQVAPKEEEPVAVPNHTEEIKSQVLAKVGRPLGLRRVEVCRHHNGNYRVNIWVQPEADGDFASAISARIRSSYYLKVSDAGRIIHSNPPLTKIGS
jgi:hypothetical protein